MLLRLIYAQRRPDWQRRIIRQCIQKQQIGKLIKTDLQFMQMRRIA